MCVARMGLLCYTILVQGFCADPYRLPGNNQGDLDNISNNEYDLDNIAQ